MALDDILQGLEDQKKRIEANLAKIQSNPPTKEPTYQPTPKVQPKELKLTPRQKGFALLRAEDFTVAEAAKMVGYSRPAGYLAEKKIDKYRLDTTKMLSLAHKAVKNIVQGLPVGESEAPKPSTILDAARMSMDRAYPLKTINESTSLHTFIEVKVDMDKYKGKAPINVTPEG